MRFGTNARRHIVTPDGARAKRGALSWRTKRLLFAPGLILRFTLTHPSSLQDDTNFCLGDFFTTSQGEPEPINATTFRRMPSSLARLMALFRNSAEKSACARCSKSVTGVAR